MADRKAPGLAEVWHSLSPEKRRREWQTEWAISLVFRPLGTLVAWGALRLGIVAASLTFSTMILTAAMPVCAVLLPMWMAAPVVFLIAFLHQTLDCADGAVARVSGTASDRGARFDFLVDMAHWGLLYSSIGILAARQMDGVWIWAALGVFAGWLRLYARVINDSVPASDSGAQPGAGHPPFPVMAISGLSGAIPFMVLSGDWLFVVVIFLLVFAALDVIDATQRVLR